MLNSNIIYQLGITFIPLGKTSDAIALFEEAIRWNPDHEFAHYYLGNGYARKNYSQLREEYPEELCDDGPDYELSHAAAHIAAGRMEDAHEILLQWIDSGTTCANAYMMLGSVEWNLGNYRSAADAFKQSLARLPEYGRAHNGLAKAYEGMRLRKSIYREADSLLFEKTATPDVPLVEKYILNWESLSPRHQKQVAISVDPWKAYLPVLIESGSHHYIKPLHEKLSECPGLETIADQRINYDSRLWDDVRGAGGFTTITGIEDVERSIYFAYNTVLHEMTHQVHSVFPPEDVKRIEDLFHAAYARDEHAPTYMSRYQASSEWEYFAEGANALYSPQRNKYDTREVVKERLFLMDTALVALVEYYITAPNLEACYPVGLCNASEDAVEKQKLDDALMYVERAAARDPKAEPVLSQLSHVYSLRDNDSLAIFYAKELTAAYPQKAASYETLQTAQFFSDGKSARSIEIIESGRNKVSDDQRIELRRCLGFALNYAGRYDEAATEFSEILKEQSNDPNALWGLGNALAGLNKFDEADSVFSEAVKKRSGVVGMRLDYAQAMIMAKRMDKAGEQVVEASLLAPKDGDVLTFLGWIAASGGDFEAAKINYTAALETDPHYRLASVLLITAEKKLGNKDEAARLLKEAQKQAKSDIPEWHYVTRISDYEARKVWPDDLKKLLADAAK